MGDPSKYLLIEVPNYMGGQDGNLNSYLCLGQPGDQLPPYGEDLAYVVTDFADDSRQRQPAAATNLPANASANSPSANLPPAESFPLDDDATPPGDCTTTQGKGAAQESALTESGRKFESSLLHTKGGWRDHSDGNRITTTRGDKVEVIRGNYRLVVLGRRNAESQPTRTVVVPTSTVDGGGYISEQGQAGASGAVGTIAPGSGPTPSDLTNAVSMDISGGLVDFETYSSKKQDGTSSSGNPGAVNDQTALNTEYVWSQNADGLWGWTQRTFVGAYGNTDVGNGKTISYTWVDEIWSFQGSPAPSVDVELTLASVDGNSYPPDTWDTANNNGLPQPVKKIVSKVWGETIVQETNATQATKGQNLLSTAPSVSVTTNSDGTIATSSYSKGTTTNIVSSDGHLTNETTTADSISESYVSHGYHMVTDKAEGAISSEALAGGIISSLNVAGGMVSGTNVAVGMVSSVEIALMLSEIHIGILQLEQRIGTHQDTHLGGHVDTHMGMHQDVHLGIHNEVHNGIHNQFTTAKFTAHEMHIANSQIWTAATSMAQIGIPPSAPDPAAGADTLDALNNPPPPAPAGAASTAGSASGTAGANAGGAAGTSISSGASSAGNAASGVGSSAADTVSPADTVSATDVGTPTTPVQTSPPAAPDPPPPPSPPAPPADPDPAPPPPDPDPPSIIHDAGPMTPDQIQKLVPKDWEPF